jgi:Domain of unknown function (DUF5664)
MTALKYDDGKPQGWLIDSWVAQLVQESKVIYGPRVYAYDVLRIADSGPGSQYDASDAVDMLKCMFDADQSSWTGVARVLAFGAQKYAAHNWRLGMPWSRLISAAWRHLSATESGVLLADDSLLPHNDHAACNLMFLASYHLRGLGINDLYQPPKKEQGPL